MAGNRGRAMNGQAWTFPADVWPQAAAGLVQQRVAAGLRERGECSVMLTGGRSAGSLYRAWAAMPDFRQLAGIAFYFGDERCVAADHPASNYDMARQTLFRNGLPAGCRVFRMEADTPDHDAAARRYEQILPEQLDVLLLGVGEDGHVASLFPGSPALHERLRRVVPVVGPKPPPQRLTITPPVIARAKTVFVLATGLAKARVWEMAMLDPADADNLPARLVLNANWLLDAAPPGGLFIE
ncbi:6-phosphogluconolactonase [Sulfuritalea hydrogenivorans]|uniref:6-phosphogluconolactonase n=1 Tax=Sulfuritalea hydrogenivorans sk43H TaxID=1223802 RepID=W0SMU2_9PROT|nr:6-phosphogluconolactonase [Sulfuritalea hydrogenivorans]BAO31133.1 6-phosphogluconolactonase [Sulfuritalea hydrogenivorans sk43H]